MPEEPSRSPAPFDVRTVNSLVSLMTQHDLTEIDLRDGNQRLRLRRGGPKQTISLASHSPLATALTPAGPPAPAVGPRNDVQAPAASTTPSKPLVEIKSPTVGTFYTASNPESPPFVKVGSKVTPTTVVCIIEAMKIFNEINAECSGTILEILVENQQPVEYGQVLFRVDPTGG